MQENKRNKETSLFKKPQGFRTVRIHFTAEAIEWLGGTTKDDDGNTIGNHTLFYDLLSRMRLSPGRGDSFRRPQELQPGQFQFSETRLAEEWNIGRKRIRNLLATMEKLGMIAVDASKTASVASMTCVEEWTDFQNFHVVNLCNPALNGIRTASEWHFIRQRRHAAGEVKTSFSFEICQGITSLRSVIPWRSRGSLAVRRWRRSQARTA